MVPMRDGVRLATHVVRPRSADAGPVPTIFVKTPYNMNLWGDGEMRTRALRRPLEAVRRGYAYVTQNERGKFYSEGEWDILGPPKTDGYDMLDWIAAQPWSNGKVGTLGCSSTAEWQMGLASLDHPAHAAMVPQGFGAGVGRIGDWYEQGNWYRGGAEQMLFFSWLYGVQNTQRPQFDPDLDSRRPGAPLALLRSRPRDAARRLAGGVLAPAARGPDEERGRARGDLRGLRPGGDGRPHDPAHAGRPGVVPGRPLPRRRAVRRPESLVHVVVRRLGRPQPRALQPRAGERSRRRDPGQPVRPRRAGRALRVLARGGEHGGRRARRGRCPLGVSTGSSGRGSTTG
jgi:hypothetical protein